MATLYRADGTTREVLPKGRRWTLPELQELVGGCIERVPHCKAGDLIVNEEGQLMGLDFNQRATNLTDGYHYIVGDALLIGRGEKW